VFGFYRTVRCLPNIYLNIGVLLVCCVVWCAARAIAQKVSSWVFSGWLNWSFPVFVSV